MSSMTRRRRLRRRGHYLLTFGTVQLLLGLLAVFSLEASPPLRSTAARVQFLELLHPPVYLGLSAACFGLCLAAVWLRRAVWERLAFTSLAALAAGRAGLLVIAALTTPGAIDTSLLSQAVVFLLILRVHVLVAGWPEPQRLLVLDEDDWHTIAQEMRRRLNGGEG